MVGLLNLAGNIACCYVESWPIIVSVCFITGVFKMVGMSNCLGSLMLNLGFLKDYAVFFPVIFAIIFGTSNLVTIVMGWCLELWNYHTLHLLTTMAVVVMMGMQVLCLRRTYRQMPYAPLRFDVIGLLLWTVTLFLITYVFTFGEHYDWYDSEEICIASFVAVVTIVINLARAHWLEKPYFHFGTFKFHIVWEVFVLFLFMCVMLATSTSLQTIFTSGVLHLDVKTSGNLNWLRFAGTLFGCVVGYITLARLRLSKRIVAFLGFCLLLLYNIGMYFLVDASIDTEMLWPCVFLKGAGQVLCFIVLKYSVAVSVPFVNYFEALGVAGFTRSCFGSAIGGAIASRLLNWAQQKNLMILGENFDAMNPLSAVISTMQELQRQVMMVSIKEVYGWFIYIGIFILALIVGSTYRHHISPRKLLTRAQAARIILKR